MKFLHALGLGLVLLSQTARADGFIETPVDGEMQRDLTTEERAWFARPLVALFRIIDRGATAQKRGPCRLLDSQKRVASPTKPEALVPGWGVWSPGGLMPEIWSIGVSCGDVVLSVHFGLDVATLRRTEGFVEGIAPPPVVARGTDYLISEGEVFGTPMQEVLIGDVGDKLDYSAPEGVPSRAAPRVVAIMREGASTQGEKGFVDIGAVRKMLASLEKAPPLTVATESEAPASAKERLAAERSALAFLLPIVSGPGRPRYVVSARSNPVQLPAMLKSKEAGRVSEVLRSAVVDYVEQNQKTSSAPTGLDVPDAKVSLVKDLAATDGHFDQVCEGLRKYEQLSGGGGLVRFSRVGLSRDLSQAIVYARVEHECPQREGALYVLKRSGSSWVVLFVSRYTVEWPDTNSGE